MVRNRAERQFRQTLSRPISTQSFISRSSESTLHTIADPLFPCESESCAPYLVPPSGPAVTLEWLPDPESGALDEAEEVWRGSKRRWVEGYVGLA